MGIILKRIRYIVMRDDGAIFCGLARNYHMQMFTLDELEEIADHLYAVVKRVRRAQEDDAAESEEE